MLVCLGSVKGSPGATSTGLALAATWPRPVALIEADPAGGDLTYRARPSEEPDLKATNLLGLAASVRSGSAMGDAVRHHSRRLPCGVHLVAGNSTSAQARGMVDLWPALADACATTDVDLIVDVGRMASRSAVLPIAQAADVVLLVATPSLESVKHLDGALHDLVPALSRRRPMPLLPVLVGPDRYAAADCCDVDELLARSGHRVESARALASDPKALARLERGEAPNGAIGRTLLLRGARALAHTLVDALSDPSPSAAANQAPPQWAVS